MARPSAILAAALPLTLGAALARAEMPFLDERAQARELSPPQISNLLLEPAAETRFHLTTRLALADGDDSFGGSALLLLEPEFMAALGDNFALGVQLPIAYDDALAGDTQLFLGNARVSAAFGYRQIIQRSTLATVIAAGLDIYAPTRTATDEACERRSVCLGHRRARQLRAYQVESFIQDAMMFRPRFQFGLETRGLWAAAELAVTPGFYVRGPREGQSFVRYGVAGRLAYDVSTNVRPYVELGLGGTLDHPPLGGAEVAGLGDFDPDDTRAQLTLGVRLFVEEFAPAAFVTVDLDRSVVFFGLDVAGVIRRGHRNIGRIEDEFGDEPF